MSKRKLTRKQAWRINKIQEERAARAAKKSASIDNLEKEGTLGEEQKGLVIAHYGTQVVVQALDEGRSCKRCHLRANLGSLVTGDHVIWCDGDPMGVIVAVLPRHSALSRPDPHGDMKTVAANIDHVLVTIAPLPKPHTFLIDRYLVAAEAINIKPAIILNKTDLINSSNHATVESIVELYRDLGYQVIEASTTASTIERKGLEPLKQFLKGKTSVFVGQSGVGKSSLINALLPDENQRIGALSESTQKGTHTTTTAHLFHFPDINGESGGQLIDSPGIREFGLWHMDEESILEGFIEFRPYIGQCKFRDCRHEQEPGCAIQAAYKAGKICERRMSSYLAIKEGLKEPM